MMADKIVGLKELGDASLQQAAKGLPADAWIDLDSFSLSGVRRVDSAHLAHTHQGQIPAVCLLAGHAFLRPGAARGGALFAQPGMAERT